MHIYTHTYISINLTLAASQGPASWKQDRAGQAQAATDWLLGKSEAKTRETARETKRYLEAGYTQSGITDFKFKALVVVPGRSTSSRAGKHRATVSTRSVGKPGALHAGGVPEGSHQSSRHGERGEPPSTRLRLVPCADAGDRRKPVLHERPHRISRILPVSREDQKLSRASAHLRLPLQGDPGSELA